MLGSPQSQSPPLHSTVPHGHSNIPFLSGDESTEWPGSSPDTGLSTEGEELPTGPNPTPKEEGPPAGAGLCLGLPGVDQHPPSGSPIGGACPEMFVRVHATGHLSALLRVTLQDNSGQKQAYMSFRAWGGIWWKRKTAHLHNKTPPRHKKGSLQ